MFKQEVMDKVTTETVSTNHNRFEEKGEPKRYRTEALPLGQTSSPVLMDLIGIRRRTSDEPLY